MHKRAVDLRQRLDALAKKQSIRAIHALANRVMDEHLSLEVKQKAAELGTLDQDDRSKQYPIENFEKLKEAANLALTKTRRCERLLDDKDAKILKLQKSLRWYRIAYVPLISILTGLALEGLKAVAHLYLK